MDALFRSLLIVGALSSLGAGYRTPNFVVTAHNDEFAKQVGEAAEVYRRELAIEWTGKALPGNWSTPCPIHVKVGTMGAGGATTFNFQSGEVYGWKMEIFGSEERILDSVLPHEINHTIFACHFRRPLPRWADEGAASLIENESERMRLQHIHNQVMNTTRRIPLQTLLEMKNYPSDKQQVLTMYAEGHSLADFLIQRSDKATYLRFLQQAHEQGWNEALKSLYQFDSVAALERVWDQWVMAGSPALKIPEGTQVADTSPPAKSRSLPVTKTDSNPTIRGQSPGNSAPHIQGLDLQPSFPDQELRLANDLRLSRKSLETPLLTTKTQGTARISRPLTDR